VWGGHSCPPKGMHYTTINGIVQPSPDHSTPGPTDNPLTHSHILLRTKDADKNVRATQPDPHNLIHTT